MSLFRRQLSWLALTPFIFWSGSLASAATICPSTVNTNTDCGFIITIGAGNTLTGAKVTGANPYDGNDDALVGLINNSGRVYTDSFALSGSGNGGGIFGFDGDGICTYTNASYCSTATTGYEGPLNTFSNISSNDQAGTVNIKGLAAGASTYFSLEGSPKSIVLSFSPEPTTNLLMAGGLLMLGFSIWRKGVLKRQ